MTTAATTDTSTSQDTTTVIGANNANEAFPGLEARRNTAIDAVNKALAAEASEDAPELAGLEVGGTVPIPKAEKAAEPTEATPAAEEAKNRVTAYLAQRAEKAEMSKLKAELEQANAAKEKAIEEAKEQARREVLESLQRAPGDLLRTHKLPADQLAKSLMDELTQDPQKQLERDVITRTTAAEERAAAAEKRIADLEARLEKQATEATVANQRTYLSNYVGSKKEEFPFLHGLYGSNMDPIRERLEAIRTEYRESTGQEPDFDEAMAHLEKEERERYAFVGSVMPPQASAPQAKPRTGRANGGLAPSLASGKASGTPSPFGRTEEERRQRAAEAYENALRNSMKAGSK